MNRNLMVGENMSLSISKAWRVIFVERRIPGTLFSAFYKFQSRLGRKSVILKSRDGLHLKCFTNVAGLFVEVFVKEDYGFPDMHWTGATVIDIGANQGFFSIYAAKRRAHVLAFEPTHETLEVFRENVRLNDLPGEINLLPLAVTGDKHEVEFFIGVDSRGDQMSGTASILNDDRGGSSTLHRTVKAIPVNEIFSSFDVQKCDLLKVDCEGAEYEIFQHISDENLARTERIAIEVHGGDNRIIYDRLAATGFRIVQDIAGSAGLIKAIR